MNPLPKFLLVLSCAMAVTACGGSQSSPTPQNPSPPNLSTGEILGGTPDQPFAQRVAQTPYPTSSLLDKPDVMKRILGPDADHNGIRDDVDALIATLATDPIELKAYQQYARVIQQQFSVSTKTAAYQTGDLLVRAQKCVTTNAQKSAKKADTNSRAAFDQSIQKLKLLDKQSINTLERVIRSNEVDLLSHGHTFSFGPSDLEKSWCD